MNVAFYAPMKAPNHPVPSGDRAMARAFVAALRGGGHEVRVASTFRSYDRAGDPARQRRLAMLGARLAGRYEARHRPGAARPDLWFTYHLYHKAPDWLGPAVSRALRIPYLVAEASSGAKQAAGPWGVGYRATADALRVADAVLGLNPADATGVRPLLADPARLVPLTPFLDVAAVRRAAAAGPDWSAIADAQGLNPSDPWLVTVAMMRADQKLASYRVLARALEGLRDRPWRLLVIGGGPAEAQVHAAFASVSDRVVWLGEMGRDALLATVAACDFAVWPAVKESWSMALLEAQALGVPVVAGRSGGVPAVVEHGVTGLLAPEGDAAAFAAEVATLLDNPDLRSIMADHAGRRAPLVHDLGVAARTLDGVLRGAVAAHSPGAALA